MKHIILALLIITIAATISICTIKPVMHKTVFVYDSAYTLVPEQEVEIETKTIPLAEKISAPTETVSVKTENIVTQEKKPIQTTTTQKQTTTKPKAVQTVTVKQEQSVTKPNIQKQIETSKPQTTQVIKQENPISETKTQTTVKITVEPEVKTVATTPVTTKVMTQQEETIAWNTWRSNLQNKIMQDVKLPVLPTGIIFRFSFTVDCYGKISNLQTWSDNPTYTPYAIQYIAPIIRSYQGRSILNFPEGSTRKTTDVKGGWKISSNEKYSTPQDFNDIEKVVR